MIKSQEDKYEKLSPSVEKITTAVDLGYRPEIITLMNYTIVNIHFLLPYHHATVMIGIAREFYDEKYMLRFGLIMTPLTFVLLYLLFFKYWEMIGLL